MFNWFGFRRGKQFPVKASTSTSHPLKKEPDGGNEPDAGQQRSYVKKSSAAPQAKESRDVFLKVPTKGRQVDDGDPGVDPAGLGEIEILSYSWGTTRLRRPAVLIPVCIAIGACIAIGFLLFGGDSGGEAKSPTVTISDVYAGNGANLNPGGGTLDGQSLTAATNAPATAVSATTMPPNGTTAPTSQSVAPTVATTVVATTLTPVEKNDPQFKSCEEAMAKGFGPYVKGKDPEYEWYPDTNRDGIVCDK